MRSKSEHLNQDGFTLLETLVALILLAVATTMFANSVSAASGQLSGADRLNEAAFLGSKLLAETNARSIGIVEGLDDATHFRWRRATVLVDDKSDSGDSPILLISLAIYLPSGQEPLLQLNTALVDPLAP